MTFKHQILRLLWPFSCFFHVPPKSKKMTYPFPVSCLFWSQWAHSSLRDRHSCICIIIARLENRDDLYSSNIVVDLIIFMPLLPISKFQNIDLSKLSFMPVLVWMSSIIPDGGKLMYLHNNCEAGEQRWPSHIKYSCIFDNFHSSTLTPKVSKYWPLQNWIFASCGLNKLNHSWWM